MKQYNKKLKLEQVEDDLCLPFLFDLPLPASLIYIETLSQCQLCYEFLSMSSIILVGMDTETEPIYGHKTSLIQLAIRYKQKENQKQQEQQQQQPEKIIHGVGEDERNCSFQERVYIFDLLQLSSHDPTLQLCNQIFSLISLNSQVIKIVHGLQQDVSELLSSYPTLTNLIHIIQVLETNSLHHKLNPQITTQVSLKYLTRQYLHSNLIKFHQCSSWGTRPLTSGQINYAACDALVLLRLYDAMCYEINDLIPDCDLQECMTTIDMTTRRRLGQNDESPSPNKKLFRSLSQHHHHRHTSSTISSPLSPSSTCPSPTLSSLLSCSFSPTPSSLPSSPCPSLSLSSSSPSLLEENVNQNINLNQEFLKSHDLTGRIGGGKGGIGGGKKRRSRVSKTQTTDQTTDSETRKRKQQKEIN